MKEARGERCGDTEEFNLWAALKYSEAIFEFWRKKSHEMHILYLWSRFCGLKKLRICGSLFVNLIGSGICLI